VTEQLRRLIEAEDELERELILSARSDEPSRRALERTLLSLGVGLTAVPVAAAGATSSVAAGSKLGAVVLAKWLLSGVALGLATAGAAHFSELLGQPRPGATAPDARNSMPPSARGSATSRATPANTSFTSAKAETPPRAARAPAPVREVPLPHETGEPRVVEEPLVPPPASSPRPADVSMAVEAEPLAALARETTLIDAARRALARGDAHAALATLAGYEREFSQGALEPEASVLKVRALLGAGDRAGAEALGRRIVAQAPRSEHARAVRTALAARPNP